MQPSTMPAAKQLTPRQLQLLNVITSSLDSRCYSPTIAELAEELRISRSTVFEHIAELRKKNLLRASQGRARSLRPTLRAQKLLSRIAAGISVGQDTRSKSIRLAGCVAAGSSSISCGFLPLIWLPGITRVAPLSAVKSCNIHNELATA